MAPLAIHKHAMQSVLSLYLEGADQYHSLLGENGEYGGDMIGKQNKTDKSLVSLSTKGHLCVKTKQITTLLQVHKNLYDVHT